MAKAAAKSAAKKPAKSTRPDNHIMTLEGKTLSTKGMAQLLGLTERRLNVMVVEGTVPALGRGKFDPIAVVTAYVTFLKEGTERRSGSSSMDKLREEKALDLQIERARKDRELVVMEEAEEFFLEVAGMFASTLDGLPAQITGVPDERQRINGIIDIARQRLIDSLAKKRKAFSTGREDSEAEAED